VIGRLSGKVIECAPDHVLLDVSGVGYELQIPLSTFYALSGAGDQLAVLHVHTHVREDALQLFGFGSLEERSMFELLIGISGIGPRLALAILSGIGVDELHGTVVAGDRARLQRIPGVGKKTAERLLLELRDRFGGDQAVAQAGQTPGRLAAGGPDGSGAPADAVSALVNLGYAREVAARAVNGALEELDRGCGIEPLLKAALGRLVR